jgi:hypothetical protein
VVQVCLRHATTSPVITRVNEQCYYSYTSTSGQRGVSSEWTPYRRKHRSTSIPPRGMCDCPSRQTKENFSCSGRDMLSHPMSVGNRDGSSRIPPRPAVGGGERGTNCTGQNATFWGDASSHPAASFTATDPKFHSDENDAAHASACTRRHSTSPRADRSSGTPAGPRLAAAPRSIGQTVQLPLTLRCPAPRRHVERRMGARHRSLAFVPCRVAELAGARTLSTGCGPSACRTLWSSPPASSPRPIRAALAARFCAADESWPSAQVS